MIRPFLDRHPEIKFTPVIRHNHRYDGQFQSFQLNANRPIFLPRKRILLVCEQYSRLAAEWQAALAENPNHILIVSSPGSAVLLDPVSLDQVIVCDTAAPILLPFLEKCRRAGASMMFVTGHSTLPSEFEPLISLCDDAFALQDKVTKLLSCTRSVFYPAHREGKSTPELQMAVFCNHKPEASLLVSLANQVAQTRLTVFCPPGELPALPPGLIARLHLVADGGTA